MNETQRSRQILREKFKAAGGLATFVTSGSFGTLEGWYLAGEMLVLHGLPANGGVEIYRPMRCAFETLLEKLGLPGEATE